MGVRFACHQCGKPLHIKSELAGKRGICPGCQTRFRIPPQDAERSLPLEEGTEVGDAPAAEPRQSPPPPPPTAPPPAVEPGVKWYVRPPSGGQYGPADAAMLQQWVEEGRIATTALLWRDGWANWREAREAIPQWSDRLPEPPPAKPLANGPPPPPGAGVTVSGLSGETAVADETSHASLQGQADLGAARRARSARRMLLVGLLTAVCLVLLIALALVASR